jgi:hypothetical protein
LRTKANGAAVLEIENSLWGHAEDDIGDVATAATLKPTPTIMIRAILFMVSPFFGY